MPLTCTRSMSLTCSIFGSRRPSMLFNRPANLILGAITAITGVVFLSLSAAGIVIPVELIPSIGVAEGAIIAVVAYQPPTLNPGDTINVVTPAAQPNQVQTVAVSSTPKA